MKKLIKKLREMTTTQEVLNYVKLIQADKNAEIYKEVMGLVSDWKTYENLELIGYRIAVRKACSPQELEECAVAIEENYCGDLDSDEWAEQIRLKAYGIEWYLSQSYVLTAMQEFVCFVNEECKIQ
ncbi:MAG: hypothetical protein PHF17_03870 [Arcobacteraceae bacterium]|nr:hypothetical protein [Arcobacteraceae bacterium]